MKNKISHKIIIVAVILFSSFLFAGCTNNKWTLMICESPHSTGGCGDLKYTLKGYKTQRECMEKGIEMKNPEGFECGYSCEKWGETDLQVCDEICNEKGCN